MIELAGGSLDAIAGEVVGQAAAAGDRVAREILSETIEMLALWLGNVIDLLDPEVIVVGGGAAALLRPFFDRLRQRVPQVTLNPRAGEVPIRDAHYGADSGIAGAAALCASEDLSVG
jgi:glucokinase